MEFVFEENKFYVWVDGLVAGEVFFSSPLVLLDVVGLDGEHALMVPARAGYVVDGVVVHGRQALDSRHSHGGQKAPVILLRVVAKEKLPWKERGKVKRSSCFVPRPTAVWQ